MQPQATPARRRVHQEVPYCVIVHFEVGCLDRERRARVDLAPVQPLHDVRDRARREAVCARGRTVTRVRFARAVRAKEHNRARLPPEQALYGGGTARLVRSRLPRARPEDAIKNLGASANRERPPGAST